MALIGYCAGQHHGPGSHGPDPGAQGGRVPADPQRRQAGPQRRAAPNLPRSSTSFGRVTLWWSRALIGSRVRLPIFKTSCGRLRRAAPLCGRPSSQSIHEASASWTCLGCLPSSRRTYGGNGSWKALRGQGGGGLQGTQAEYRCGQGGSAQGFRVGADRDCSTAENR
jgi:hypothetical protein